MLFSATSCTEITNFTFKAQKIYIYIMNIFNDFC